MLQQKLARKVKEVSKRLKENFYKMESNDLLINSFYKKDGSHGASHIHDVLNLAEEITNKDPLLLTPIEHDALILSCILHDITRDIDDDHHEESGAMLFDIMMKSSPEFKKIVLTRYIDKEHIDLVKYAIKEHRASYKGDFYSKVSEVLSSVDRGYPENLDLRIKRSFLYAKEHGKDDQEALIHAIDHMKEKFGRNGYQKLPNIYKSFFKNEISILWDKIDDLDYGYKLK